MEIYLNLQGFIFDVYVRKVISLLIKVIVKSDDIKDLYKK